MKLKEVQGSIFDYPRECILNIISADFKNGYDEKVSKEIGERYGVNEQLIGTWKTYIKWFEKDGAGAIVTHDPLVINLCVKAYMYYKPTREALKIALKQAADMCYGLSIFELSISKKSFTEQGFQWEKVNEYLERYFGELNMLITVYE